MKKIIKITLAVIFTVIMVSCSNNKKHAENCCQTEECKKNCTESGCCEEGKTCDITNHKDCKHKCCDADKKTCLVDEIKTCCKTK